MKVCYLNASAWLIVDVLPFVPDHECMLTFGLHRTAYHVHLDDLLKFFSLPEHKCSENDCYSPGGVDFVQRSSNLSVLSANGLKIKIENVRHVYAFRQSLWFAFAILIQIKCSDSYLS